MENLKVENSTVDLRMAENDVCKQALLDFFYVSQFII